MSTPPTEEHRDWRRLGLFGAAACVACCAGPVLAAVGGFGALGSVAAFLVWPAAGGAVALLTVAGIVLVHRRRSEAAGQKPVRAELSSRARTD